jgi:hypothetical protein
MLGTAQETRRDVPTSPQKGCYTRCVVPDSASHAATQALADAPAALSVQVVDATVSNVIPGIRETWRTATGGVRTLKPRDFAFSSSTCALGVNHA